MQTSRYDALGSAEVTEKVLSMAVIKASLPLRRQLPLTFFGGLFIALGALFSTLFFADPDLPFAVQRFAGGAVFSLGLSLVLVAGAELYTGNTMMAAAALDGRLAWGSVVLNWLRVWLGNALGALTLVALVVGAHTLEFGHTAAAILATAKGKLSADASSIFFKGVLCNLLVCLGVWMGYAGRGVADKILGVLLPVTAFVALGFEHCVANLFFLPLGWAAVHLGYAPADFDASAFTFGAMGRNLFFATLGNTVAGAALAILYRAAHRVRT